MRVKVGFTPGEELTAPVGVVIDVLRATSVITQAFAAGYKSVTCTGEIEDARELAADEWGVKLAGERHNVKIDGFDFGNSPREFVSRPTDAMTLVTTTTNGTRLMLAAARRCETVFVASLLNLHAVCAAIRATEADEVAIMCAGVEGAFAIDDAYVAGRIAERLDGDNDDSALAAIRLAQSFPTALDGIGAGISAQNIRDNDLGPDIDFAAAESVVHVVPRIVERSDRWVRLEV
jgi:2-phosphosulfolactate phosphatase